MTFLRGHHSNSPGMVGQVPLGICLGISWVSQAVLVVKNPPASAGDLRVQSLGQEDPLKEEMANCFSILAWRESHGQRSLVGYGPRGHRGLDTME